MKLLPILTAILAAGCATTAPTARSIDIDGKLVTEVINHSDAVPGCAEPWAGCAVSIGGAWVLYYRPFVSQHTFDHERAHVAGMKHGAWEWNFWKTAKCAAVTTAGGGYKVGETICVDHRSEWRIAGGQP